ncbi:DNA alkylation repair protein [Mucilaginibacter sp. UR6-11]|uniref:DNA alkylation repair protein n=1 Tax=Mucilaginibacter sp. UR6-11 TaxID=1435644 RepID=UPI001E300D79|nr:DNA alkylation repair protein [Mucilaginibacter sp. UR6-11]MCC8423357.1 DNA alkylation repair protein [Mucilaginibacter sp. UR6-11]
MTVPEIMADLKAHGSAGIKKILVNHGVKEPFFGVKIEYLKTIQKKIKKDYQLAKDLYATGNADAMYLAGLITDDKQMTKADLQAWVKQAVSNNVADYTVPWVAAEGNHGYELAMGWIDSGEDYIASAGWFTLGNLVTLIPDDKLPIVSLKDLLTRVEHTIHASPNRVRSGMNIFVICVGGYVNPLTDEASAVAKRIGPVTVIKEGTACKVPFAPDYIEKTKARGSLNKKKKTVKC